MRKSRIHILVATLLFAACSNDTEVTTDESFAVSEFPDGSIAYLNAASELHYKSDFERRVVWVAQGEVYFDVAPGEDPFVVKTPTCDITVTGTEFNVRTTAHEVEVEVEEGMVQLKTSEDVKEIKKAQKALVSEAAHAIEVTRAELKHRQWLKQLEKEWKKMGKELKKGSRRLKRDARKLEKELLN